MGRSPENLSREEFIKIGLRGGARIATGTVLTTAGSADIFSHPVSPRTIVDVGLILVGSLFAYSSARQTGEEAYEEAQRQSNEYDPLISKLHESILPEDRLAARGKLTPEEEIRLNRTVGPAQQKFEPRNNNLA